MKIMGFQKLTVLDYPETIASIIFTSGCNLLCPFCHNPLLVVDTGQALYETKSISEIDVINYLEKRKKVLQGLCISGGEPLLQNDLEQFIEKVKNLNLKIKLDTNGCFPDKLKNLIDKGFVDYVALDIKNSVDNYPLTVGISSFDPSPILRTAKYLKDCGVKYELRTTLIKELHTLDDLECIGKTFGSDTNYYLQNFRITESVVNDFTYNLPTLTPFTKEELNAAKTIMEKYFKTVTLRGL